MNEKRIREVIRKTHESMSDRQAMREAEDFIREFAYLKNDYQTKFGEEIVCSHCGAVEKYFPNCCGIAQVLVPKWQHELIKDLFGGSKG